MAPLLLLLACAGETYDPASEEDRGSTLGDDTAGDEGPRGPGDGGASPPDTASEDDSAPEVETGGADYPGEPGQHELIYEERGLWLYVPEGYDPARPIPLLIGFHGAGDSGQNFYNTARAYGWTGAADQGGFALLIPSTKSPYDDFAIWSGNPNNDVDEMIAEMDEILEIAAWLGQTWHIDPAHLHAFGFSDGGLFTAVAGMHRSETFASLTILSYGWGGAYPLVTPTRSLPVQFACGDRDSFFSYAEQSEAFLSSRGHDTRMERVSGVGHSFSGVLEGVPAESLAEWMLARPLP